MTPLVAFLHTFYIQASEEEKDKYECLREFVRSMLGCLGLCEDTQALDVMWIALTKGAFDPNDCRITSKGHGACRTLAPNLEALKALPKSRREILVGEVHLSLDFLDKLEHSQLLLQLGEEKEAICNFLAITKSTIHIILPLLE